MHYISFPVLLAAVLLVASINLFCDRTESEISFHRAPSIDVASVAKGVDVGNGREEESAKESRIDSKNLSANKPNASSSTMRFRNFEQYFKRVNIIDFSKEILLGKLTSVDADKDGKLLVVDALAAGVYLFDSSGNLLKKIFPENCLSEILWRPFAAKFMTKGKFFVLNNSSHAGIIFYNERECASVLSEKNAFTFSVSIDAQDNIYSFYARGENSYIAKTDIHGKKLATFGDFRKPFEKLIAHHGGGGLVCGNGVIYQAILSGPEVYVYNSNGRLINTLKRNLSFFKPIEADLIAENTTQAIVFEIKKLLKGKTIVHSLFFLDQDKLLIQYLHDQKMIIDIFDTSGKPLVDGGILADNYIALAKFGKVYVLTQPGLDQSKELPNPRLDVYEFTGSQKPEQ